MKRKSVFIYTGIISIVSLAQLSCSSGAKTVATEEVVSKPDWVQQRPVLSGYYTGIAVVSKTSFPTTYAQEGQKMALNELASEIQVNVSSNSMLFTFENKEGAGDQFKEFTKVTNTAFLENYEKVDAFETQTEYWVYYRLSKQQYRADLDKRVQKAIGDAKVHVNNGNNFVNQKAPVDALKSYFEAIEIIKPYAGEELKTTLNNEEIYLGAYLTGEVISILNSIEITPVEQNMLIKWGEHLRPDEFKFKLTSVKGDLKGLPVKFEYSNGFIRPRIVDADANGLVASSIGKMKTTKEGQYVQAVVYLEEVLKNSEDTFNKKILKQLNMPLARINLQVLSPKVLVVSNEKSLGKKKPSELKNVAMTALGKKGFRLVNKEKEADVIMKIMVDTKADGVTYDLYRTAISGTISFVETKTGKEVYHEDLSSLKGVKVNYELASKAAYSKLSSLISNKIAPRFYRRLLK